MAGFPEEGNAVDIDVEVEEGGHASGHDRLQRPHPAKCSHSALPVSNPTSHDREIELREEELRAELDRYRGGLGENIVASTSSSANTTTEDKELEDITNTSTIESVPNGRSARTRGAKEVNVDGADKLSPTLEYISALAHLTTFGILGVCIRYGLRILFSDIAKITSSGSSLFIDLPANMVGCFFMGWVGVVLKKDIAAFSELLVIGLSTGLMGSITTYASWNQELIVLVTNGLWVRSIVGLIIGMELSQMSLTVGMDSAKLLRSGIMYIKRERLRRGLRKKWCSSPDGLHRQQISMLVFTTTSAILWIAALVLTVIDVDSAVRRRLWLSCVVGPPGVWARWLLARLNGQGIGRKQYLKWLPVGTLLTNIVASTLQGVLSTVLLASPEDASLLIGGLQTGLLGCMSTVSTFVTEIYSLHQSPKSWRAYAYFCISFFCSYSMGALTYTLPVLVGKLSL